MTQNLVADAFVKPESLDVKNPKIFASYGPRNCLRQTSTAVMHSTTNCSFSIKSVSANSLILADELFFYQPVQIILENNASDNTIIPNRFADMWTEQTGNTGAQSASTSQFDSLYVRPYWIRAVNAATLTINGHSFSVKTDSFIDCCESLWGEGGFQFDGAQQQEPYTNQAHPKAASYVQHGVMQRCRNFMDDAEVKTVYAANGAISYQIIEVTLCHKLWIGPWFYAAFPRSESQFGNSIRALPYCTEIQLDIQWDSTNPLIHMFACPSVEPSNGQAVGTNMSMTPNGAYGPDFAKLWARNGTADMMQLTEAQLAMAGSQRVSFRTPYLTYESYEPNPDLSVLKDIYTVASMNFQSYQQYVQITTGRETALVTFPFIRLDTLPSLMCISATYADKDIGTQVGNVGQIAYGGKLARWDTGAYVPQHLGASYANINCPIRWETLKISVSNRNQALGSMSGDRGTLLSQHRLFLKYSGRQISLRDYAKYKQMLIVSPEELGLGFGNQYMDLVLSVSFEIERPYSDTGAGARRWGQVQAGRDTSVALGRTLNSNFKVTMCQFQEMLVALSEQAAQPAQVRFAPQAIAGQFTKQVIGVGAGGTKVTVDSGRLDDFIDIRD